MYEAFTEADVRRMVAAVRKELPGFTGRIPLRVARPDPDITLLALDFSVKASAEWSGRTCTVCLEQFVTLDHVQRKRNSPWIHRRCAPVAGQVTRWVDRDTMSGWLYRAGATFAGWAITPGVEVEFCVGDLPASVGRLFPATNTRSLLYGPHGELIRENARPELVAP